MIPTTTDSANKKIFANLAPLIIFVVVLAAGLY